MCRVKDVGTRRDASHRRHPNEFGKLDALQLASAIRPEQLRNAHENLRHFGSRQAIACPLSQLLQQKRIGACTFERKRNRHNLAKLVMGCRECLVNV